MRIHHPEEDPEGYQFLREAYEWAKKQVRVLQYEESYCEYEESYCDIEESGWNDTYGTNDTDGEAVVIQHTWESDYSAQMFFEQMEALYDDFSRRMNPEHWNALMTNDYMWNMEYQGERLCKLLKFLEDRRHLPRAVWEILNQSFQLLERKEYLFEIYDQDEIAFILRQIQGTKELGYACFEGRQLDFDIEHYLTLRQDAQTLLMEENPVAARDDLEEAHAMFRDDPDLQLLRAKCYIMLGQRPEAMSCLQQVLELKPEEYEARLLIAQILYEEQRFHEAEKECRYLQQHGFLSQDVSNIYGSSVSDKFIEVDKGVAGGILFVLFTLFQAFVFWDLNFWYGWHNYLNIIVPLILTCGVYKKSRTCAVLMLVYFVLSNLYLFLFIELEDGPLFLILLSLVLIILFIDGVKGTFAYHRHMNRKKLSSLIYGN
ncbi:tetratricopeptide repeat protein [Paenibacillus woosongensis]|uniref:tetratricopeptide repeat protein n=1 Tax=Paenibacillus woosongensis TaxID=307580 RepID=UPI0018C28DCF|nr:tetratricopeptide repeat protein [Paenibacillus woosongensis]